MQRKVYLIGLDGMMHLMYQRLIAEGVLSNFKCLAQNGVVSKVYSSLPCIPYQLGNSSILLSLSCKRHCTLSIQFVAVINGQLNVENIREVSKQSFGYGRHRGIFKGEG